MPRLIGVLAACALIAGSEPMMADPILGVLVDDTYGRVVVTGVYNDSAAARAGLQPGDMVWRVGNVRPRTAEQMNAMLGSADGGPVSLGILRRGHGILEVTASPEEFPIATEASRLAAWKIQMTLSSHFRPDYTGIDADAAWGTWECYAPLDELKLCAADNFPRVRCTNMFSTPFSIPTRFVDPREMLRMAYNSDPKLDVVHFISQYGEDGALLVSRLVLEYALSAPFTFEDLTRTLRHCVGEPKRLTDRVLHTIKAQDREGAIGLLTAPLYGRAGDGAAHMLNSPAALLDDLERLGAAPIDAICEACVSPLRTLPFFPPESGQVWLASLGLAGPALSPAYHDVVFQMQEDAGIVKALVLDGSGKKITDFMNELGADISTPAKLYEYLSFFASTISGVPGGTFRVIPDADSRAWNLSATEADIAAAAHLVSDPGYYIDPDNGNTQVETVVAHDGRLFRMSFLVTDDLSVTMLSENAISGPLPLIKDVYLHGTRFRINTGGTNAQAASQDLLGAD